jgi:hypothetical protein
MTTLRFVHLSAVVCLLCAQLFACSSEKLDADDASSTASGDGGSGGASRSDGGGATGADASRGFPRGDGGSILGRGRQDCPATRPSNGSACVPGRGECTLGAATCDCLDDSSKWVCWEPSDCPSAAPAEAAACNLVGIACSYREGDAGRAELDCSCTAAGWDCGRQICPPTEPSAGGACTSGDGTCSIGGRVCDCRSRAWVCWNASDCPATQPTNATACAVERMVCEYPQGDCECGRAGFECEGQRTPRDGGVRRDASVPPGLLDASVSLDGG